jgi:hypothetical protein
MRHCLILGYPGVLKWEMSILLQISFILLCKQNVLFCDVELVLKCVLIKYAELLYVIINSSHHSKTIKTVSHIRHLSYIFSMFSAQDLFKKHLPASSSQTKLEVIAVQSTQLLSTIITKMQEHIQACTNPGHQGAQDSHNSALNVLYIRPITMGL